MVNKIPAHVAVIMDGNGRWAQKHGRARTQGHLEGVNRVDDIVQAASTAGVKVLTLFTFSTENWQRDPSEVSMLMRTIIAALKQKLQNLCANNIRLRVCGRRDGVPLQVLQAFDETVMATSGNSGMVLNIAFNYGGRQEILDAVRAIAADCVGGKIVPDAVDEALFTSRLYTAGLPDPDLLIRTSGEKRISNFLLWQLSYAELYFTEKCWPEFTAGEFNLALEDFARRDRRYGSTGLQGVKV